VKIPDEEKRDPPFYQLLAGLLVSCRKESSTWFTSTKDYFDRCEGTVGEMEAGKNVADNGII